MNFKKDVSIWIGSFFRGLAVAGLTFFSVAVTQGFCEISLQAAGVSGGLYMFLEILKFYKIDPSTVEAKPKPRKYLLFP